MNDDFSFEPDWQEIFTAEQANYQLGPYMNFKGPGWYFSKLDTMLVLPSAIEGHYRFMVYNGRNPTEAFNRIVNAPVQQDDR